MDEARRLGVAGYVKKPFMPETIKKMLYEVLEKAYQHKAEEAPAAPADDDMDF